MIAVNSGNVEWCGGRARRVVGSSFCDRESSEYLSDMVVNFGYVRPCEPAICETTLSVVLDADNVELQFVLMTGAMR
jgi:hypothetical protein